MVSSHPYPEASDQIAAFGVHDSNLRLLERLLSVKILLGPSSVQIEGEEDPVTRAGHILRQIYRLAKDNNPVSHQDVKILVEKSGKHNDFAYDRILTEGLPVSKRGKKLKPRNLHQSDYLKTILSNDLTFAVGPAGTGKTYLAVGLALHLLNIGRIQKVILTRPVVEAGESLGFLPGTLEEKIDPYLRPLYDAMGDMLAPDELRSYMENQTIEIAPLAYMRGRTLSNAFVILDEAQNTTAMQMKLFLTRLGEHSKMVVTGDITQIDLGPKQESGLKQATELFQGVEGIGFAWFDREDVVRHELVRKILEIYEFRRDPSWNP